MESTTRPTVLMEKFSAEPEYFKYQVNLDRFLDALVFSKEFISKEHNDNYPSFNVVNFSMPYGDTGNISIRATNGHIMSKYELKCIQPGTFIEEIENPRQVNLDIVEIQRLISLLKSHHPGGGAKKYEYQVCLQFTRDALKIVRIDPDPDFNYNLDSWSFPYARRFNDFITYPLTDQFFTLDDNEIADPTIQGLNEIAFNPEYIYIIGKAFRKLFPSKKHPIPGVFKTGKDAMKPGYWSLSPKSWTKSHAHNATMEPPVVILMPVKLGG